MAAIKMRALAPEGFLAEVYGNSEAALKDDFNWAQLAIAPVLLASALSRNNGAGIHACSRSPADFLAS